MPRVFFVAFSWNPFVTPLCVREKAERPARGPAPTKPRFLARETKSDSLGSRCRPTCPKLRVWLDFSFGSATEPPLVRRV